MIKVTFTDGTSNNYRIGSRRLGALKWKHLDYRPCFKRIAEIIGKPVESILNWRVI